jgi:hypothetical protein
MASKKDPKKPMTLGELQQMVLDALRLSPKHTYWFRERGNSHPAARVGELIEMGFKIETHRVTAADSDGFLHRGVALYELISERTPDLVDQMQGA